MNDISIDNGLRQLDPFGFFSGHASRIKPLGGTQQGPDPAYAFHTPYMEYRPGPVVFAIRIHGLEASFGELVIHVNSFVPGSGAHALLVTMSRVSMVELANANTDIVVRINALPDMGFAVFGYFPEGTDASAIDLTITAEELGTIEDAKAAAQTFKATRYGNGDLQRPAKLIADHRPSFRYPLAQLMTAPQLEETSYFERALALSVDPGAPEAWTHAFVIQVLETYGFLQPGARGLALGDGESPLAAYLVAKGCTITTALHVIDEGSATMAAPHRYPALCSDEQFDAGCTVRAFDPRAIDDELRGFDFLWSIDLATRLDSFAEARNFIEQSMRCLRPGGLAIHMFDILLDRDADFSNRGIGRQRVEALALTSISKGNDAVQLNFGGRDANFVLDDQSIPFGLLIYKGR